MQISVELSAILSMGTVFIFWLAGLSFMTKQNAKDIEEMKKSHNVLDTKITEEFSKINKSLARIEGRLSIESHAEAN